MTDIIKYLQLFSNIENKTFLRKDIMFDETEILVFFISCADTKLERLSINFVLKYFSEFIFF